MVGGASATPWAAPCCCWPNSVVPGTFLDLCCYEPVVMPPAPPPDGFGGATRMSELARKRRPRFASREEACENFASKPPMNRFDPAALDAYVTFGFVDEPERRRDPGLHREKTKRPIYKGLRGSHAWDRLAEVRPPVTVLGGEDPRDPVSRYRRGHRPPTPEGQRHPHGGAQPLRSVRRPARGRAKAAAASAPGRAIAR